MKKLSQKRTTVLNEFEARTDHWKFGQFETALEKSMGSRNYGNYQTAKTTIITADEHGKWPKTVERYVLTNYKTDGTTPSELTSICSRLLNNMSKEELESYGIDKNQLTPPPSKTCARKN